MDLESVFDTTCTSKIVEKFTNVLMDLIKAYCLPRDLLLTKLSAYGFDESAIALIPNYLSNRYQLVIIRSTFSSYLEILRGVPQG